MNDLHNVFLKGIKPSDYDPLGSANYPAYSLYQGLSEILEYRLWPDASKYIAQPIYQDDEDIIDYFSSAEGSVVVASRLNEPEKNNLYQDLQQFADAVKELSESLNTSNDVELKRLGAALSHLLKVPDLDSVYLVGEQPVLVAWGFVGQVDGEHLDLTRLIPPPAVTEEPTVPPVIDVLPEALKSDPVVSKAPESPQPSQPEEKRSKLLLPALAIAGLIFGGVVISLLSSSPVPFSEPDPQQLDLHTEPLEPELSDSSEPSTMENQEMDRQLEEAGGEQGEITFTLFWEKNIGKDIDLHLVCPKNNGHVKKISYKDNLKGGGAPACGGWTLDVDNTKGGVENINLKTIGLAYRGQYELRAHMWSASIAEPISYTVRVSIGTETKVFKKTFTVGKETHTIFRFNLPLSQS